VKIADWIFVKVLPVNSEFSQI